MIGEEAIQAIHWRLSAVFGFSLTAGKLLSLGSG